MAHTCLLAHSLCLSSVFECSMMVPGNAAGVAKQFLRCIFHQLAPNGIFPQLFQSAIKGNSLPRGPRHCKSIQYLKTLLTLTVCFIDGTFLRTLATSLMDFNELSSIAALSQLLEVGSREERPRPQSVSGTTPVSSMNCFFVLCCTLVLAPSLYEQHREVPLMSPCPAVARKKAAAAIINSPSLYSGGFFPAGIIHCLLSI